MMGMLPLANSVWLLVIIGALILLAIIVISMATAYHMTPPSNDDGYQDDYEDGEWHQHVRVLHPHPYDWENDR
jgi:hypothetical protein